MKNKAEQRAYYRLVRAKLAAEKKLQYDVLCVSHIFLKNILLCMLIYTVLLAYYFSYLLYWFLMVCFR